MKPRSIGGSAVYVITALLIGLTFSAYSQENVVKQSNIASAEQKQLFTIVPTKINFHPVHVGPFETEKRSDSDRTAEQKYLGKGSFPKQSSPDNGWHFAVAPYLYATGISGTVGARGRTIDIDASFGDVLSNLKLPLMVSFEARKKRFFSLTDMIWVKLSDERDTAGDLYSTRDIGVNLFILDPEVGYRLIDRGKSSFDVLGGARIWSVENNINVTSGRLPGFDVSMRKTWAAPVVGVRGSYDVSPKFFLSTRFDIGGAGIGADLTTQFYGGGGYRIVPNIALVGGYRFMQVDYDDHSGFLFDTRMNGIVLGAKFSF